MNAVIFKDTQDAILLPFSDDRAKHIQDTLHAGDGDEVYVGIAGGPLGIARIAKTESGYIFPQPWRMVENPKPIDACLCVAYARPQITKRILFDAASMGVRYVYFYPSEKSFSSYAKSSLFAGGLWKDSCLAGLAQGCRTDMPKIDFFDSFEGMLDCLSELDLPRPCALIAPDLYEATSGIKDAFLLPGSIRAHSAVFVLGSERGFSSADRDLLRSRHFVLASLGGGVMRTDTAAACCAFSAGIFLAG